MPPIRRIVMDKKSNGIQSDTEILDDILSILKEIQPQMSTHYLDRRDATRYIQDLVYEKETLEGQLENP